MTTIARRIIATPTRSASQTWSIIVHLLAPQSESTAHKELLAITGIASSLIADEAMETSPIIVYGSGPRVRIYCLFDEDAITNDSANETALAFNATEGNWAMSIPCLSDDLTWVQDALKKLTKRVTAHDMVSDFEVEKADTDSARKVIEVDEEAFFRQ